MNYKFKLPLRMSPSVAHSHEMLLKLAKIQYEKTEGSYFINSEITSYDPRSDAPKNRAVRFNIELDENGDIIDDTKTLAKGIKVII